MSKGKTFGGYDYIPPSLEKQPVPPEPPRKIIPYRVDSHTVVYLPAKLTKAQRKERFEQFCIKHQLGAWRDYVAAKEINRNG